jgi:hypothetical protein
VYAQNPLQTELGMSALRNFHTETALGLLKVQALASTFSDPAHNSRFQTSIEGKVSHLELLVKKNKTAQTVNRLQDLKE